MQSEYTDYFDFSYIHIFGDRTMKNPLAHWKRPLPVPVQVRRNLFSPFDSIFERMTEDFYRDFERPSASFGDWENLMLHPCVDIIDTQNAFKVKATFKKGMLWIEIPKKAGSPERYREITVESAAS